VDGARVLSKFFCFHTKLLDNTTCLETYLVACLNIAWTCTEWE